MLDSLYQGNDVVEAARVMANYLKEEGFTNHTDFNLPHLGALFCWKTEWATVEIIVILLPM